MCPFEKWIIACSSQTPMYLLEIWKYSDLNCIKLFKYECALHCSAATGVKEKSQRPMQCMCLNLLASVYGRLYKVSFPKIVTSKAE